MIISPKEVTQRRVKLGISKAALAREAGLHPSQLSLIELGRLVPYESQQRKLADALDRLEKKEENHD